MKKLTALFICILLIGALAMPAVAASTTQMTIAPAVTSAVPGDEVTFEISISGDNACTSFGVILEYDSSVFELVSGKCLQDNGLMELFDPEKGFAFLYEEAIVPSGVIGTFTLKVKADAPSGAATVSGMASVKNGSEAVASEVVGTSVTISGGSSGGGSGGSTSGGSAAATEAAPQEKPMDAVTEQEQPAADVTGPEQTSVGEMASSEGETIPEAAPPEVPTEPEVPAQERTDNGILILCLALVAVLLAALVAILMMKKNRRR